MSDLRLPLTDEEIARLTVAGVALDDGKVALLEHPDLFIAHYFGLKLKDFHVSLVRAATMEPLAVELFPAGHGKTTIVSQKCPIWAMCRNPDIRIGAIAKNERDGSSNMRSVQAELQENAELIRDFGPFRDSSKTSTRVWSVHQIEIMRRTRRHPRPTLQVYGAGGNVFGHRTDWTICDDVVTDKNSNTEDNRARTKEWFNLGVRTMPEPPTGRLTVVGTRFHPEDLYGDLIEAVGPDGERLYHVEYHDAIVDEDSHESLWPEQWTWESLMSLKSEVGSLDFNKRYRNVCVDPSRLMFREEYLMGGYIEGVRYDGCLDSNYSVGDVDDGWLRYGGFDPAIGVRAGHSWCVHTSLMVGSCEKHDRCFWIVDQVRDTMSLPQQADTVIDLHQRYGLTASRVEVNAYQKGLKDLIDERMGQRGLALRIDGHLTTAQSKVDPEIGVAAMAPAFERGHFHIPWATPDSRRKMKGLIDELVSYPGARTTDRVMSLWIAWLCAKQMGPRYVSFSRMKPTTVFGGRRALPGQRVLRNPYYDRA